MELRRASTALGCGCAAVIALFLVAVLTLTWATYRAGEDFERQARDPDTAAERAREVVAFAELPEGYRALGTLSVPLLLDVALFMPPIAGDFGAGRDGAAGEPEKAPDRGFLYVRLRDWMGRGDELREALGGSAADDAPLDQQGLAFDPREVVARGHLVSGRAEVQWLARRGSVTVDPGAFGGGDEDGGDAAGGGVDKGGDGGGRAAAAAGPAAGGPARRDAVEREPSESEPAAGGPAAGEPVGDVEHRVARAAEDVARAAAGDAMPGILSILAFDCPGDDSWQRLGVWYGPDPAPDRPAAEIDWSGGPADPQAIADFLGHFELCG